MNKIFEYLLIMLSVFLPFLSEEIYLRLCPSKKSSCSELKFPEYRGEWIFPEQFQKITRVKAIIRIIRSLKEETGVADFKNRTIIIASNLKTERNFVEENMVYLKTLIKCKEIIVAKPDKSDGFRKKWEELEILLCFKNEKDKSDLINQLEMELKKRNRRIREINERIDKTKRPELKPAEKLQKMKEITANISRIREIMRIKDELK
jgi:valyl-tRNA synthetase